jgi:hypothetical protein
MDAYDDRAPMGRDDAAKLAKEWAEKIRGAEKREKDWMDAAEGAEKAYLVDHSAEMRGEIPDFNILHSNVETIVPAIYNSTPAPEIRPRHNVKDDVGKLVSDVFERALAAQIDDNRLDSEIEASAQDAFLAGRGVVRVRFDAEEGVRESIDPHTGLPVMEPVLQNERVVYENVSWRDYRQGAAKRWSEVPWIAFRHCLTREEIERIGDPDLLSSQKDPESDEEQPFELDVWEVWCRSSGRVYFITDDGAKLLKVEDDPLGLSGFFPIAKPVQPICGTGRMTPVCPYTVYDTLAKELDAVTKRINRIVAGLKVVGFFATGAEDLVQIADVDDNTLVPIKNMESAAATGGVAKAIEWWPVDQAIMVLRELYAARDQTKASIYEITGISDIIRGHGMASETATAQNIKTQWGSLRIKKMQRLIERQVRDLFVLGVEIMSMHFSPETLQRASGVEIPPQAQALLSQPLNHYRVDVESDSTVRADATQQRQEMAEFLNGSAQFFSTMAPIIEKSPTAAGPTIEIYASFARRFNLGRQAEAALEDLVTGAQQMAKQPQPNAEMERIKAEMQLQAQDQQHRHKIEGGRLQLDMKKAEFETQKAGLDVQLKQAELALKQGELALKQGSQELEEAKAQFDATATIAELAMEDEQQRGVKLEGNA